MFFWNRLTLNLTFRISSNLWREFLSHTLNLAPGLPSQAFHWTSSIRSRNQIRAGRIDNYLRYIHFKQPHFSVMPNAYYILTNRNNNDSTTILLAAVHSNTIDLCLAYIITSEYHRLYRFQSRWSTNKNIVIKIFFRNRLFYAMSCTIKLKVMWHQGTLEHISYYKTSTQK